MAVATPLEACLREAAAQSPRISLPTPGARTTADQLSRLPRPAAPFRGQAQLASLLAHGIVGNCGNGGEISSRLVEGAYTLAHVLAGKGRAHQHWKRLNETNLLDATLLHQLAEELSMSNPAGAFAAAASEVLSLVLVSPTQIPQGQGAQSRQEHEADANEPVPEADASPPSRPSHPRPASKVTRDPQDNIPSVAGRMVLADGAHQGPKSGLNDRDALPLEEFSRITRLSAAELKSGGAPKAFALLAIISAVTAATDSFALNLPFGPSTSIWISPDCKSWCWDFQEYRYGPAESGDRVVQPIVNAMPACVSQELQDLRSRFPQATTLGELLAHSLGTDLPLKEFRLWLRSREDSLHPAYRARYARSISAAWLEVTGSDMGAALGTCNFAATAPAALFYFGPSEVTQYQRTAEVFSALGLGPPAPLNVAGARIGCQKVLESASLSAGWTDLIQDIEDARTRLMTSIDLDISTCNHLMVLLCAAFTVATAARGSHLERLTFSALFGHPEVVVLCDKDEGGRRTGRLVPATHMLRSVLDLCAWTHQLVAPDQEHEGHAPAFVQWQAAPAGACISGLVATSGVAQALARRFGSVEINFARCAWVTHLDEGGCDRWLIRALTGHARDSTRTSSPSFNRSPLDFARRLRIEMDRIGQVMFGSATVAAPRCRPHLRAQIPALMHADVERRHMVEDPRTLLDDLNDDTVQGWSVVNQVRQAFAAGAVDASASVLAVISLTVMDLVPKTALCLEAVTDPNTRLRTYGNQPGLLWARPHFTHLTWLPVDATSIELLRLAAQEPPVSQAQLARMVNQKLAELVPGWPARVRDHSCYELDRAVRHFTRIEFPPSLAALMREDVPAPALSSLSLQRMAGKDRPHTPVSDAPPPMLWKPPASRATTPDDLAWLRRTLAKFTNTDHRLGEARQRAVDLRTLVRDQFQPSTSYSEFIGAWVLSELDAAAVQAHGCLAIVSIYTYLKVFVQGQEASSTQLGDPFEWGEEEWLAWFEHLKQVAPGQDDRFVEHVRNAVTRLVRNLHSRGFQLSWEVRRQLLPGEPPSAGGSASSTLILDQDFEAVDRMGRKWLHDQPLDLLIFQTRHLAHRNLPSRTGEISSLRLDCLTPDGRLVIERAGFMLHKNEYAIRTARLESDVAGELGSLRDSLKRSYLGEPQFLLRGAGDAAGSARDVRILAVFSGALKLATGDAAARPHSIRARVLQDMAWPGWLDHATRMLAGSISPAACAAWALDLQTDPLRLVRACEAAGHSGVRAAIGNYLSAWPLVMRLHVQALRTEQHPGRGMVERLGFKKNTYAKAAARCGGSPFCGWSWLYARLDTSHPDANPGDETPQTVPASQRGSAHPATATDPERTSSSQHSQHRERVQAQAQAPRAPRQNRASLAYLTARILGISKEQAMEFSQVGPTEARPLDPLLPDNHDALALVRRARGGAADRGRVGNQRLLLGQYPTLVDCGWKLLSLAQSLTDPQALLAFMTGSRAGIEGRQIDSLKLWAELSKGCPKELCVLVRRAPRHIGEAEMHLLQTLAPAVTWRPDRDIGAQPVVSIALRGQDNRVVASRATSVLRCALQARVALDHSEGAPRSD